MKGILLLILFLPTYLNSQENLSIAGTYKLGNDINKENVGEILVVPKADNHAIIYISTSKKAPSYNTFSLLTEVEVIDNKAYYQLEKGSDKLVFSFSKNGITTTDLNSITNSHIPLNNTEFKKISNTIPKHFMRGDGENIELSNSVEDFTNNYFPNTSIWEFIGVWQFGQGRESLNISKNLANDNLNIQYNSWSDGFEDRFFDNCKFIKGKIIGDYYGGKQNVILEIEEGNLLLTIDPFHQFQPIKKQEFKKYPQSIFKYCAKNGNTYIKYSNKNVDSLPPGERILMRSVLENNNYIPTFYLNRFNKTPPFSKKDRYIVPKHLSDIKPLFLSEEVNLKFYQNLNESERFVKELYSPEKLKENTKLVEVPEQNIVGQKTLLIDKEVYSKLGLSIIKKYYDNNLYISGTVDLSQAFYSITVDDQSDNEYYTYLINYDKNGKYIDHILIGRNDYVESFTPIKPIFAPGEVYVNSMISVEVDYEMSGYKTFESKRYIINTNGQFIENNYASSYTQTPDTSILVTSQRVQSKTFGNANLSLFLNILNSKDPTGGYGISLHAVIQEENGMETTFPMDLSEVCGFHYPPDGKFTGPHGVLQKLFYTNIYDEVPERLQINFHFSDVTNDDIDELFIEIIDNSYVIEPKEYLCFIKVGGSWIYSEFNEKVNLFNGEIGMPFEMIFKSYYQFGYPPYFVEVTNDKKQEFLLKNNEHLIYTFKVENSDKRVCIGVADNCEYLVYRFGVKNNIEFEYIAEYNNATNKFNYYLKDETITPPRDYLENISFTNKNYQYIVYNNYIESDMKTEPHIPSKDGIGIMVRNMNTSKVTYIEADEKTIQGHLGLVKQCIKDK
jgi:hypothetical protein